MKALSLIILMLMTLTASAQKYVVEKSHVSFFRRAAGRHHREQ